MAVSAGLCKSGLLFSQGGRVSAKEASWFDKLPDKQVRCRLCPRACVVSEGRRGHCDVRENRKGTYYSLVYGQIAAAHQDPIEKKPFYHFLPGSTAFSIATAGCNVDCRFCQNADLAQRKPEELQSVSYTPEEIVRIAESTGSRSIAYTYNEPIVFYEFMRDTSRAGRQAGLRSVVISNGFISQDPLKELCGSIDAYKVDLKAFSDDYYREIVGGRLQPVLDTLVTLKSENIWTEIVYLVVPTLNDDPESIKALSRWILNQLGPDVPLHFSRFYPKYRLRNLPPTPIATLKILHQTARSAGLNYVYIGNVPGDEADHTYCPSCSRVIIRRLGYQITEFLIQNGKCTFCGNTIPGVWS